MLYCFSICFFNNLGAEPESSIFPHLPKHYRLASILYVQEPAKFIQLLMS